MLIAVTEDKFHQVISAKGNASKLVTILSDNSGRLVKVKDAKIAFYYFFIQVGTVVRVPTILLIVRYIGFFFHKMDFAVISHGEKIFSLVV